MPYALLDVLHGLCRTDSVATKIAANTRQATPFMFDACMHTSTHNYTGHGIAAVSVPSRFRIGRRTDPPTPCSERGMAVATITLGFFWLDKNNSHRPPDKHLLRCTCPPVSVASPAEPDSCQENLAPQDYSVSATMK